MAIMDFWVLSKILLLKERIITEVFAVTEFPVLPGSANKILLTQSQL